MSKEKRYYWIRLTDELMFKDLRIKKLRTIAGGDTFTIIYLKMMLLAKNNNGIIEYEGVESDIASEIALKLDEDIANIKMTISYLANNGLLELTTKNNQDIYLPQAETLIGSESSSAERVRKYRERQKQKAFAPTIDPLLLNESNEFEALQCNTNVTENAIALQCNTNVTECNTEREKERENINTTLHINILFNKDFLKNQIFERLKLNNELDNLCNELELLSLKSFQEDSPCINSIYLISTTFSIIEIFNSSDKPLLYKLDNKKISDLYLKAKNKIEISEDQEDYSRFLSYFIKMIKNDIEGK